VKPQFQADADLNEDIVKGVLRREPKVDFRTATSARLRGLSDLEVLTIAAEEGRILVSHDRKTMPRTFAQFTSTLKYFVPFRELASFQAQKKRETPRLMNPGAFKGATARNTYRRERG